MRPSLCLSFFSQPGNKGFGSAQKCACGCPNAMLAKPVPSRKAKTLPCLQAGFGHRKGGPVPFSRRDSNWRFHLLFFALYAIPGRYIKYLCNAFVFYETSGMPSKGGAISERPTNSICAALASAMRCWGTATWITAACSIKRSRTVHFALSGFSFGREDGKRKNVTAKENYNK